MSKIGYFLAVKPEQADELVNDPASVAAFVAEAQSRIKTRLGADFLDVDKSWHGIHYSADGRRGRCGGALGVGRVRRRRSVRMWARVPRAY